MQKRGRWWNRICDRKKRDGKIGCSAYISSAHGDAIRANATDVSHSSPTFPLRHFQKVVMIARSLAKCGSAAHPSKNGESSCPPISVGCAPPPEEKQDRPPPQLSARRRRAASQPHICCLRAGPPLFRAAGRGRWRTGCP